MRIGIDARMLGPKQGGLGRYAQQLILNLEKIASNDDFVIFLRKENWNEYEPKNPRFKKVLADIPWYGWQEQILLPAIIKKEKVDLMHFPHWNVPLFYNKPFTVTIHDLLLLHYPTREASTLGATGYFFKQFIFKKVLRHAASQSKKIITVSEFSKNDIAKTLNIPTSKISVTYPANFTMPTAKEKNNDANKYVLYVGSAYPHKNLPKLLEAWAIFQQKYKTDYKLILAGKEDYFYKKLKNQHKNSGLSAPGRQVRNNNKKPTVIPASVIPETVIPAKAGIQSPIYQTMDSRFRGNDNNTQISPPMTDGDNSVIFAGFIPDKELPALYTNASLYVFPSLYEGFGLPPLEAMSHNIPVISSNFTCLPEILKNAALYFNPENPEEIAQAVHRGLMDQNLRTNLIKNGQKLCSTYSWEKLAKQTLETYRACG